MLWSPFSLSIFFWQCDVQNIMSMMIIFKNVIALWYIIIRQCIKTLHREWMTFCCSKIVFKMVTSSCKDKPSPLIKSGPERQPCLDEQIAVWGFCNNLFLNKTATVKWDRQGEDQIQMKKQFKWIVLPLIFKAFHSQRCCSALLLVWAGSDSHLQHPYLTSLCSVPAAGLLGISKSQVFVWTAPVWRSSLPTCRFLCLVRN